MSLSAITVFNFCRKIRLKMKSNIPSGTWALREYCFSTSLQSPPLHTSRIAIGKATRKIYSSKPIRSDGVKFFLAILTLIIDITTEANTLINNNKGVEQLLVKHNIYILIQFIPKPRIQIFQYNNITYSYT